VQLNNLKCILVAEDDEDDMFFLRRAFERAGLPHRLVHVNNGQKVMEYLLGQTPFSDRTQHPFPDLLLLDLKMPKMDGLEVLQAINCQAALQELPVVILSSSGLTADVTAATKLGADDYIVKPGEPDELRKMVLMLNEQWLGGATPQPESPANHNTAIASRP
jgi:CheY-like chemotaxis protein